MPGRNNSRIGLANEPVLGQSSLSFPVHVIVAASLPPVVLWANLATVIVFSTLFLAATIDAFRFRRRPSLIPFREIAPGIAFGLWVLVSSPWAINPRGAALASLQLVALLGMGWFTLAASAGFTPEQRHRLLRILSTSVLVACAIVLSESWTDQAIFRLIYSIYYGPDNFPRVPAMPLYKTGVTVLTLVAVLVAGAQWQAGRRLTALALGAGCALAAYKSSSMAALCALVAAGSLGLLAALSRKYALILITVLVAAGFTLPPAASLLPSSREIVAAIPLPNSALHRLVIWQFAGERILEKPVAGWGMDASRALPGGKDVVPVWSTVGEPFNQPVMPLHPHNFAVQIWLETGLIGAILFAAGLLSVLRRVGRDRVDANVRITTFAAGFTIACISYGAWQSWWVSVVLITSAMAAAFTGPGRNPAATSEAFSDKHVRNSGAY